MEQNTYSYQGNSLLPHLSGYPPKKNTLRLLMRNKKELYYLIRL